MALVKDRLRALGVPTAGNVNILKNIPMPCYARRIIMMTIRSAVTTFSEVAFTLQAISLKYLFRSSLPAAYLV